jgi:hypothetical protein
VRDHVRLLGALYIAVGAMGVLGSLIALVVLGGVAGILGAVAPDEAKVSLAAMLILAVGTGVVLVALVMSIPNIIAGVGLLQFKPWARVLTLILSALNLLSLPFGTALGLYGFWVLMSGRTDELFDTTSRPTGG